MDDCVVYVYVYVICVRVCSNALEILLMNWYFQIKLQANNWFSHFVFRLSTFTEDSTFQLLTQIVRSVVQAVM